MEETQRPCKRVVDSQTEQTYLMRPNYLNCYGNLFGGQLMGWIDEIASIVAMRHCEADITTAAIDNLNFKGHTMGGFGGSNKNIGIGCADGRIGKAMIHTAEGSDNMWSIAEEELMQSLQRQPSISLANR